MQRVERTRAIEEVSRYCDLTERLPLVPPSAKVRGLYFRSIEAVLTREGRVEPYRHLFPERVSAIAWQPASEYLVRLAIAGGLLLGPERVHDGMFEIGRRNAVAFAESILGRTLLRFLSHDPKRLLQQGAAGRRQSYSFGHWDLEFPGERSAVVTMTEEYFYIESHLLGAATGTFEAIGMRVEAQAILEDRFRGRHLLHW